MKYLSWMVIASLLIASPVLVFAEVSKIVFTSSVNSASIGVASEQLTVQLQDSSGSKVTAGKTLYINFKSSSPTGKFSTSNTNWEDVTRTYISSNWSNRNFYYRDTAAGQATITISVEGELIAPAVLNFNVGDEVTAGNSNRTASNLQESESNSTASLSDNYDDNASVHSNQVRLSQSSEKLTWEISAGRPRRVLVNMPLILEAKTVKGEPKEIKSFSWSFGDGESFRGRDAVHIYRYPGTYQVVVNGRADEQVAVARTKVVVEKPLVNVRWSPDGTHAVQLKNNNSLEINLGGFRLGNASTTILTIPNDTILAGGGEIIVPLPGAQLYHREQVGAIAMFDSLGNEVAREQVSQPTTALMTPVSLPEPQLESAIPESVASTSNDKNNENVIELKEPKTSWWQLLLNWLQS